MRNNTNHCESSNKYTYIHANVKNETKRNANWNMIDVDTNAIYELIVNTKHQF